MEKFASKIFKALQLLACWSSKEAVTSSLTLRPKHSAFLDAEVQAFDTNGKSVRNTSIPVTDEPVILRAFRDEVTRCVVEEAKRLHPAAITFHFNSRIRGVDLHRQVVHVGAQQAGSTQSVEVQG